jgi:putative aminopeptidase FrvX
MDKTEIGKLLKQLVEVDGPSGVEGPVAAVITNLASDLAHEVRVDTMGSVILRRRGAANPPGGIMLAAHLDEIGLIVTKVEGGFLHIGRVGGVVAAALPGQEVTVYPTGPGADKYPRGLTGYIGARPPHMLSDDDRKKVIPLGDLRIDLGLASATMVRVGDRAVVRGPYTELLGGRVATKALDNRASVAAMLGALGYLAGMKHDWDVFAVATVQEEVGLFGAVTSAFGVAPDIAIAIDVTFGATPGLSDSETVAMDKGPAIGWGPNLHPGIVKRLREAGDALEIPYVTEPLPGASGTDAWAIQVTREGIPTGLTSLPIRYMHSPVETIALADIDRTARLLAAFIGRLDATVLAKLPEEV